MTQLGHKAITCLKLAALEKTDYASWERLYNNACVLYSQKAIDKKMEDLAAKGYIDYGVSARTGWLTDKGREALNLKATV